MTPAVPAQKDNEPATQPRRGRAVRPKLSASLILLRGPQSEPQVLMGRRAAGHGFMPSKIVFPGGRVERSDCFAPLASDVRAPARMLMARHLSARRLHATAAAAIRETFEETGLMLARPKPHDKSRQAPKGWDAFAGKSLGADLGALEIVARAITPPYHHKRFDAWFFMARADSLIDLPHHKASGELEELGWLGLQEALASDIPVITSIVLQQVQKRLTDPDAPRPWFYMRRGQHHSQWL